MTRYLIVLLLMTSMGCTKLPTDDCGGLYFEMEISNKTDDNYFIYLDDNHMIGLLHSNEIFRFKLISGSRTLEAVEATYDYIPDRRYETVDAYTCGGQIWLLLPEI